PMKITSAVVREDRQVALTIEPDEQQVQDALRQAARKIARNYNIPGFRKGKAPYAAVVRAFGKEALLEQVAEDMSEKILQQALEETGLQPIAPGSLEDVTFDPLVYRLILPMGPDVDLGDYRSIRLDPPVVEVSEEDVQAQLQEMQERQTEWIPVEDGAGYGDLVTAKIIGVVEDETILEDDAFELILEEENQEFPPGFDAEFVGLLAGATHTFEPAYPEDWPSERAGKVAQYEVEVISVKREDVPALDDDFAPLVGDYDTLDELKESVRDGLAEQRQQAADGEYLNEVMEAIIEGANKIEYAPVMVEDTIDRLVEEQASELRRAGFPFEEFLRLTNRTVDDYREEAREAAESRLRADLVMGKLIDLEGLEATDEEIDELRQELLADSPDEARFTDFLQSDSGRLALTDQILRRKVIERMRAIASGTAPELPAAQADGYDPAPEVAGDSTPEAEPAPDSEVTVEAGEAHEVQADTEPAA
ncbi:MAG: trigger factor, partial [Anaerolineae bacterium]